MNKEELKEALNLGQAAQVGCVVRNLAKTIDNYEKTIGIGPFMTFDFIPEKGFVKGRNPDINLKIGVAQLTPELSLELIEIVSGEPFHKDFLEQHGGGTFTDLICVDEAGESIIIKTPSTSADPSVAIMDGLQGMAARMGKDLKGLLGDVTRICHGTTVSTNTVLTWTSSKVGILCTKGFRDTL